MTMNWGMHYTRALSDLRVWMCHLCSIVGGVGEDEAPDPALAAAPIGTVPPLEPIRPVGKPYRLG
ncbi:MAG: hypothetical protein FJW86_04295 [Actinobacteria bacterium]|nr:hypothetical protein [Actinomycetota bacterium]